jgi:hypothetical protein
MSKHDLKGVDTSKVGNNKYVNYTFEDYRKDQGLSRKGALKSLGNIKLSDLEVIAPTLEQPKTILGKVGQFLGMGTDPNTTETEVIGGKVVGARRPDNIISRPLAGLLDFTTFGILDTDQRGGLFGGKHSGSGYGGRQNLDYMLPKTVRDELAKADQPKKEDKGSTNAVDNIKEIYKAQMDYEREMDPFNRKGRMLDSALDFANLQAQMPFYMRQLKDASTFKQQQLLDAELIKQGMPNAREARKLSSASRMAGELGAIADAYAKAGTVAQGGIRQPTATFSV